jgi:hypothetical protein
VFAQADAGSIGDRRTRVVFAQADAGSIGDRRTRVVFAQADAGYVTDHRTRVVFAQADAEPPSPTGHPAGAATPGVRTIGRVRRPSGASGVWRLAR